ncbi:Protein-tyrosine phosphatase mitochondrial 1 [Panicum miliaceum]|uniref:Protein-tyrosine phosphatase mitochondrial 1 n=1 Tax=Panicum miliaceum TaxID=4540 RepID=A0A3L6RZK9_PANMI|nr:Protein-tyrosine phosphatase mitochondrial 1 [Panicum miliaceum]
MAAEAGGRRGAAARMKVKEAAVGAAARVLFYPTLLYNVVRSKAQAEFRWWDEAKYKKMTPETAFEYVRSKRAQVLLTRSQWKVVQEFSKKNAEPCAIVTVSPFRIVFCIAYWCCKFSLSLAEAENNGEVEDHLCVMSAVGTVEHID